MKAGLDWDGAMLDMKGAYLKLKETCDKVFITGFCMGGAVCLAALTEGNFDGGSPFYGIPDLEKY